MTTKPQPEPIYLRDYRPPAYWIDQVSLYFDLHESHCTVRAELDVRRNTERPREPLRLHGQELELIELALDDRRLSADEYRLDETGLVIPGVPERFILRSTCRIRPQDNTALEGLYTSAGMFCTQCEAEGFRRITYFLDRPDVMARYTTTIEADRARYPVLLSNGNPVARGEAGDGRHWVRWQDPFPKPSYLFALVAGDLKLQRDSFTTASGKTVDLRLYVEPANIDKCEHALTSLKKAMRWDEERYGREYDLDIYMIVAVNDFNMGAMENKGLNIFNAACVLARPDTATDADYENIEGIIGHEYFHNWSGNRVTCRDWFQLSLKEGFTVFRDQQFSADMGSRAVKRIADVNVLRSAQFSEDAGPMAHPVRPESYIDISNFYTVTVYNKGAEVVRMIHNLLGPERFRKACDLYFERHDGQAVTIEDFVRAMEDASGVDLGQFMRWYSQAGTPRVEVAREYDAARQCYRLTLTQTCPPTPGQAEKKPFHIPFAVGLLDAQGRDIPLDGATLCRRPEGETSVMLELTEARQVFEFTGITHEPVPSLLRGFSAPVKLEVDYTEQELLFLLQHDSDDFNRWEAGQRLAQRLLSALLDDLAQGRELRLEEDFVAAFRSVLHDRRLDPALLAQILTLPNERYLAEQQRIIDPEAIHTARNFMLRQLAERLREDFLQRYRDLQDSGPYGYTGQAMGRRSLKNLCLHYLSRLDDEASRTLAMQQFQQASNMTDSLAALAALADGDGEHRRQALAAFYTRWRHDPLVLDKWFALQARADRDDVLEQVRGLLEHPAFDIKNPNKVRALIGTFCMHNPAHFHHPSGEGYGFLAEQVLRLNEINPQMAARLVSAFGLWRRFRSPQRESMRAQLERIAGADGLSKDVYEIVSKSLAEPG